jgi:hypothetical protein
MDSVVPGLLQAQAGTPKSGILVPGPARTTKIRRTESSKTRPFDFGL